MKKSLKFIWHFLLSLCVICTALSLIAQITPVATQQSLGVHRMYDVTVQGKCKGDVIQLLDGAINSSSATLTSASASFKPQDVGKQITILGAGAAGASMTTTITARPDANTLTLNTSAGTTVTGVTFYYGTDDTTALRNAYTAAKTQGYKRLYLPASTYLVGTGIVNSDSVLLSSDDDFEILGDGMGKTVLQYSSNQTLAGVGATVIGLTASKQQVHDLTLIGPYSTGGSGGWFGVKATAASTSAQACRQPYVHHVEVMNVPVIGSAGSGISMTNFYNSPEYTTTLGTVVAAPGAATCTPPNNGMQGIYVGRLLAIGGASPESVTVTSITQFTFTATFANTHLAADSVALSSDGRINGAIEYCWLHDSPGGSAIGCSASDVLIRKNRIRNWGAGNTLLHGIYCQGGEEVIDFNVIESVGGYSVHCNKSTPNFDASGDVIVNNVSIDPGAGHIVVNAAAGATTLNPMIPTGTSLSRYCYVAGNVCRCSKGMPYIANGIQISDQKHAVISGNLLEDACGNTGSVNGTWISCFDDARVENNALRTLWSTGCLTGILANGPRASISRNNIAIDGTGNIFSNAATAYYTIFEGNIVRVTGKNGTSPTTIFAVCPTNGRISGNVIDIGKGAPTTTIFPTGMANCLIADNHINDNNSNLANTNLINLNNGPNSGDIRGNFTADTNGNATGLFRYTTAFPALRFSSNYAQVSLGGNAATTLDSSSGELFAVPLGTNTLTNDLLCTLDANGCAKTCATTDTTFIGAATSSTGTGAGKVHYALLTANGTGYTSQETCTFAASGGTTATGTCNMGALSATIGAGGTGYNPGDLLTGTTGTGTKFVFGVVTAPAGVVTAVQVVTPGDYTVLPSSPSATSVDSPHAGTGCTLAVTWGVHSITMTNNGTLYTTAPAITFGTPANGAKATAYISSTYLMGKPGSEIPLQADGAWVSGNIGILSTTSGGKIHDSASQTPPASGSYVRFMNSGGAAGTAQCMVLKTQ